VRFYPDDAMGNIIYVKWFLFPKVRQEFTRFIDAIKVSRIKHGS